MRKNDKEELVNYENSIKKSNEFSMAKLNQGLTLNQMQLLAFAIYSTQKNGMAELFHKADFEKKFNLTKYNTTDAKQDSKKLFDLSFSTDNLEKDEFDFLRVFQRISYKNGQFLFKWTEDLIPHILDLKEYNLTDLTITSKFKSGFSWTLYEYLKAHYGYWHKPISKDALMRLFGVENKKTYIGNSALFKKTVLDVAIAEINALTELEVWYKDEKQGRSIVGFDLIWSNGKTIGSATKNQIKELKSIVDIIFEDMFKYINLNDEKNRLRAIELIRSTEEMKVYLDEPICITKEKADLSIQQANSSLRELEQMLVAERERDSKAPFYNWLEERE